MSDEKPQLNAQVLVVDDEKAHAEVMAELLQRLGCVCTIVHSAAEADEELKHGTFDVVVTDLVMEDEQAGMRVVENARRTQVNAEVIVVTAHGDIPTATQGLKAGAFDFIEKPLDADVFRHTVRMAAEKVAQRAQITELQQQVDDRYRLEGIIGPSAAIQRVLTQVRQIAPTDIPVLVTGESGTGKELVAHAVHQNSRRSRRAFKPLNCAGLSASILESELFGHVRGAFTGAERDRQGVFEYADGGTLFLDEIGDMPYEMQAKLLRALESGEVVRVGDNEPRHVNVRLISATNHDLEKLIADGRFRQDLLYRIRGVEIHLPPLRDRREDIGPLARHFIRRFARDMSREVGDIDEEALAVMMRYDWPGNVRQLINVVQNMVAVCDDQVLTAHHVPAEIRHAGADADADAAGSLAGMSLDQIEKQAIRNTLRMTGGNREQAAQILGIGERTLYRKLKEYGLK